MASTVLPNGIIIPEKYSRDWYADLYHNWQELDNLLSASPGDGTLTIQKNSTTVGTFSANQATDETIDITVPTKTSDLTNDSNFVQSSDLATVATSGSYNDLTDTPTIPTVNNATLTIQKNGTNVQTFTANQSTNATANITVPTKTSDLTNDSGFITSDDTKIPLAGSNAISGSLIPATTDAYDLGGSSYQWNNAYIKSLTINGVACGDILTHNASEFVPVTGTSALAGSIVPNTDNAYSLGSSTHGYASIYTGILIMRAALAHTTNNYFTEICGGASWSGGAQLILVGKDFNDSNLAGAVRIVARDINSLQELGCRPSGTLIWTGQPIQYVSDKRLKQQISEIDDALLDAWEDVDLVQFKYNDAVKEKSDNARLHTGYVVQQIDDACKSHGVDVSAYGLYCHEEYPEETEEVEAEQKDGTKVKEKKVIREASEHYSLRYTEVYAVECMYLRRCIARLTARIEELEKGNNTK